MFRRLVKFMSFVLSILAIYTLSEYVEDYMLEMKDDYNHFWFTLCGLVFVASIFFPFFRKMEDWSTKFTMWYLKTGKHLTGKKFGIIFAFFIGLAVVYYFLFRLWYGYDPWLYFLDYMSKKFH